MAEYNKEKRYWLQLKRDFFKRHDIMILEGYPNGKEYTLFYLKLMLESIDHNGELRFSDTIPYNEEMLSTITNTNIDIVRNACKILYQLGMVEVLSDGTLYLHEVEKLLSSTTIGAERKQEQRKKLAEGTKGGQLSTTIKDTIKDTNIYKKECEEKNTQENYDFLSNIPTLEEIQNFITLKNFHFDAQRFKDYYDSINWMRGSSPISNWQALCGTWEQKLIKEQIPKRDYDERTYSNEELQKIIISIEELSEDMI